MKSNRFSVLAEDDHPQSQDLKQVKVQVNQQAALNKKLTVKVVKSPTDLEDAHEFEKVEGKQVNNQRGAQRGGRGDRRGGRGGDRPRADRPETARRSGDRRRGGRGDRPQTVQSIDNADGDVKTEAQRAERPRGGRGGRGPRHQGKPREEAHPMDRQDGTGQGRRGDRKGGYGKGNWGKDKVEEGAAESKDEETKEEKPRREERKPREEPKEEEEVEEVGFTLDDYLATKKSATMKVARTHEKIEGKVDPLNKDKTGELATTKVYRKMDTVPSRANAGAELMGFQAQNDQGEEFENQKKRRDDRKGPREDRPRQNKGKKGGRLVVDDNEFPPL